MPSRRNPTDPPPLSRAPSFEPERDFARLLDRSAIAGLDEAGRGALAGPVFAAAVILPFADDSCLKHLAGVNDSKQLPAAARERLFPLICETALAYGIGRAEAAEIDAIGIVPATRLAMSRALERLASPADALLVDGTLRLDSPLAQRSLVRGDSLSLSIAAASVLAKVSRDRVMVELDGRFPGYGFAAHKGYGTALHLRALAQAGPCREHRFSFAPLAGRAGST
jgi:ribonuclease HII